MILGDLYDLYELKRESEPDAMPERFWCRKNVAWEAVIDRSGHPTSLVALAGTDDKTASLVVPDVQRTSGIRPFFLCDNAEYWLGMDDKRGAEKQVQSIAFHEDILSDVEDDGAIAALLFLKQMKDASQQGLMTALREDPKGFIVLRLAGDERYVHERGAIKSAWSRFRKKQEEGLSKGPCLVTGAQGPYATLFPQVTGLPGAQSSGASLISCNADAFSSYGQKTSTAGAISADAADKSGAALSYVLKDHAHRITMGNDYVAFWTDSTDPSVDKDLAFFLDPDALMRGEDEKARGAIQTALAELKKGLPPVSIPEGTQYHLLGIAPYQARLAVRFYETGSLGDLQRQVTQFLKDTEIIGAKPCSLRSYLDQTAAQVDSKNVPMTLITPCMRALIRGTSFPVSLQQKIIARLRADHGSVNSWDMGRRAAILKACLIRKARAIGFERGREMERRLTVGLNRENDNQGYLLGRLFALLEKVQQDAIGGANATIRDRFMGAAATTPARVYPQLLKLAQHHISKSEYGVLIDRQVREVIGRLGDEGFPKTLGLDDQGMFYIGYYQQKQALYQQRTSDKSSGDSQEG